MNFLMLPTEGFAIGAARLDNPYFVDWGEMAFTDQPHSITIYACYHDCSCLFICDDDQAEILYPDRFAGRNCREGQDCPCHDMNDWHWWDELQQKENA